MSYRSFTVHRRDGDQRRSIGILTSPGQARPFLSDQDDGDYMIRDCLGGLRMIVRVTNGVATILETTK